MKPTVESVVSTGHSRLHIRKAALLRQGERHHVRWHEAHTRIESRDEIRPNLGTRHLKRRRQLPCNYAKRHVALPEHRAACLDRLHTDVAAVVVKDVPYGRLLRRRVDDLRALAKLVL